MQTEFPNLDIIGPRLVLRRMREADGDQFIALARASRDFHHPWVELPATRQRFDNYLLNRQPPTDESFAVCALETKQLVGAINLNCIVRGSFQSAYMGYWIGAPFARRGYMTEALKLLTHFAFNKLNLHRLEANIQPDNVASITLVRKCGFRREGFSPKYLQILGEWRDHERWALLAEDK